MKFDSYKYKLSKLVCFISMPLSFITSPANSILLWKANNCKNINTNYNNHKLNKDHLLHTYITLTDTEQLLKQKGNCLIFDSCIIFGVFGVFFRQDHPTTFRSSCICSCFFSLLFIWCHYFKTPFDQNHRFSAARQNPTKITRLND